MRQTASAGDNIDQETPLREPIYESAMGAQVFEDPTARRLLALLRATASVYIPADEQELQLGLVHGPEQSRTCIRELGARLAALIDAYPYSVLVAAVS